MTYKYNPPNNPGTPEWNRREIREEVRRWNDQAGEVVVTDFDLPMFTAKNPTGEATVTLELRGVRVPFTVSIWPDFQTNLWAVKECIKQMRLAEARGLSAALREAYTALPSPKVQRDPWEVLGLRPGASADEIEAMYRVKAKAAHPDAGGSDAAMQELNDARERAKAEASR